MAEQLRPLTDLEAAYLAGFLDGEGSFYMSREKRKANRSGYRYSCGLSAAQVCDDVLLYIQKFAGGSITLQRRDGTNHQDCYVLYWGVKQMRWLIPQILPFLVRKREVASVVLEFAKSRRERQNYQAYDAEAYASFYNRVKTLNRRGRLEYEEIPPDTPRPHKPARPITACTVEGCNERKFAKGLCKKHHRHKYLNKNASEPKNCAHCGILMEEVRPDQVYCGLSCKSKAARARKKAASNFQATG